MNEEDKLILYRLDEIKERLESMRQRQDEQGKQIGDLREAVAGLRVKAGLWGAVAGFLPALGALLLWILRK